LRLTWNFLQWQPTPDGIGILTTIMLMSRDVNSSRLRLLWTSFVLDVFERKLFRIAFANVAEYSNFYCTRSHILRDYDCFSFLYLSLRQTHVRQVHLQHQVHPWSIQWRLVVKLAGRAAKFHL